MAARSDTPCPPYEKEVLGRRVAIMFEADFEDGRSKELFYDGTVRGFKIEMGKINAPLAVRHYVVFDDGDKGWFDLARLDGNNFLRWPDQIAGSN